MSKRTGQQQGAQDHAEGSQGKQTRARQQEIRESGPHEERDEHLDATGRDITHGNDLSWGPPDGAHRLFEHRQQHDEAEQSSEQTRLARDVDRHKH
ncbi:MAG: hypothetical protein M3081_17425 [Gemmatimonadota bacterium]|nr:hypothetical protein [Gemmatimonadota bacterium]